ncbi:MAG: polyhydroxyalkanoic acid system family protein [Planctomycetaceae bacterium]|nr:polyhydroxyalkanoic acid system family protein [Planctomycetaceae bacterium]
MPQLNFDVPNPLGQPRALQLIQQFMPQVQERFKDMVKDVEQTVVGNQVNFSFRTMGMSITGTTTVDDSKVNVKMELPFAALMVKGKIQSEMTSALERLLGKPSA